MKAIVVAIAVGVLALSCFAQNDNIQQTPFSVWSIHTPEIVVQARSPYPVGVLTPLKPIVMRRLESLSNRGPLMGQRPSGPMPCPVQYEFQVTNGTVTEAIPISNAFLTDKTSQTYTDSGLLNVHFAAGARILVSMVAPKAQFPAVTCTIEGLNISIQYELEEQQPATSAESH